MACWQDQLYYCFLERLSGFAPPNLFLRQHAKNDYEWRPAIASLISLPLRSHFWFTYFMCCFVFPSYLLYMSCSPSTDHGSPCRLCYHPTFLPICMAAYFSTPWDWDLLLVIMSKYRTAFLLIQCSLHVLSRKLHEEKKCLSTAW